jgi:hypothetical protein
MHCAFKMSSFISEMSALYNIALHGISHRNQTIIEKGPILTGLVGRPVKKGSILILRKNRPVQQTCVSNKIDQAVQFIFT